jgi:hypothetical protein
VAAMGGSPGSEWAGAREAKRKWGAESVGFSESRSLMLHCSSQ